MISSKLLTAKSWNWKCGISSKLYSMFKSREITKHGSSLLFKLPYANGYRQIRPINTLVSRTTLAFVQLEVYYRAHIHVHTLPVGKDFVSCYLHISLTRIYFRSVTSNGNKNEAHHNVHT